MASSDTILAEAVPAASTIDLEKAFPGEEQLNRLIGEAYFEAGSRKGSDMPLVTELLEQIRANLFQHRFRPYKAWYHIKIDRNRFDKDPLVGLLMQLKGRYYLEVSNHMASVLKEECALDSAVGFQFWVFYYVDAVLNWEEEIIRRLFLVELPFTAEQREMVERYRGFNRFFENYRAAEAFPFYLELADAPGMTPNMRSLLLTEAARSQLYGQRVRNAKPYFDKAAEIEVTVELIRAQGELHLYWNQYEDAKAKFRESVDKDPNDIVNFVFMGDVFKRETKFEEAEQWYKEIISSNCLFIVGYQRLIELYGLWEKNPEKKGEIPQLIEQVNRIGTEFQAYERYDSYRTAGAAYSLNGDYKTSQEYYQLADAVYPDHTAAKLDLGYIYVYQKEFGKAEEIFNALIKADDRYYEAYQGLGWAYEEQKRFAEAVEVYERCLARDPFRPDNLYNLIGRAYWLHEDYVKAAEYFRKAIEQYAYEPVYYENLLDALKELKEKGETETLLLKMAELFPDAVNYPSYIDKLAILYREAGDVVNTEKWLRRYVEVNPNWIAYDNLGNFYYDQNQVDDALANYQKAIDLKPDDPVLYEHAGLACQKSVDLDAAEKFFRQALALDSTSGMYFNRLGLFFYNQNKYQPALEEFMKAVEREPSSTVFQFNIAMAYDMMGKPEESLPYYEKLLTTDDQKDLIQFRLGINYLNRNEPAKALEWLNGVKSVYLENSYFMDVYGLTLEKLERWEEAIEWYNYVLTKYPEDDYFNNRLGVLYHNKGGEEEKAEAHYRRAIATNPNIQTYKDNLALLLGTPKE